VSDLLASIEQSALGYFIRDSGPWTYPLVNLAHILGIATLFGSVLVIDLALLGVGGKRSPTSLAAIAEAAPPVALTGLVLAVASGVGLLASNATEYSGNPFFAIKIPAIGLGALNAIVIRRSPAWRALERAEPSPTDERRLRRMAAMSLVCWTVAIGAGRMIGYW
jgi:hypothetical protein